MSWIVIGAFAAATLAVPISQSVDAATPKCFGKRATLVGTQGNNTIRGTRRADVIVAKGGNDRINGRGGNDRICGGGGADTMNGAAGGDRVSGGSGADLLIGGSGNDILRGHGGMDVLRGGDGGDALDGGDAVDVCTQDAGVGTMVNCETADLSVAVSAPVNPDPVDGTFTVTFTVTVTNNGPDAVPYTLTLGQSSQKATCTTPDWAGAHPGALLADGASRATDHVATCTKDANGAKVRLSAAVSTIVPDPVADNDTAEGQANLH
jgi:Ca2+-binding RTX toxin-like protein